MLKQNIEGLIYGGLGKTVELLYDDLPESIASKAELEISYQSYQINRVSNRPYIKYKDKETNSIVFLVITNTEVYRDDWTPGDSYKVTIVPFAFSKSKGFFIGLKQHEQSFRVDFLPKMGYCLDINEEDPNLLSNLIPLKQFSEHDECSLGILES